MTDILQLPGWEATGTRTEQGEFIIEARYTVPAMACIKCGVVGALAGTYQTEPRESPPPVLALHHRRVSDGDNS